MTIKTKLRLGLYFLFAVIVLLGGLGAYYLNDLSERSKTILKDNHETVVYMQNLSETLDGEPFEDKKFSKILQLQEKNITEIGEAEATQRLRETFEEYRKTPKISTEKPIRAAILQISRINQTAMIRKNDEVQKTANQIKNILVLVATVCMLISFTFILNFPSYIANPIRALTEKIKAIASKKYDERLVFQSSDEFGELALAFNKMAEKLDEYEHSNLAKILFEKRRIETLIETFDDGIIGLDEKRNVLFVNQKATQFLGIPAHHLLGRYAPDVAAVNDLLRTLIQDLMDDAPRTQTDNVLKIFADDRESYFTKQVVKVEITRTGEPQPVPAGCVIVLRNITPFKELDLAKTNFIATISHELKTPISAIKMSLKLLGDERVGTLNERQNSLIAHLKDDSERLLNITGELLNMAQVETGNIQLTMEAVNPAEILKNALAAVEMSAAQKQVTIQQSVVSPLPFIKADLDKTTWVLINLLSNAVKYGPEKGVVEVAITANENWLLFSVRDHGTGIDPALKPKLFERFVRGNNSNTSTGLGLNIAREFIQAQGGEIRLEENVENGTAFCFKLPFA